MGLLLLISLLLVGCKTIEPVKEEPKACYVVRTAEFGFTACSEVFVLQKYAVECYNLEAPSNERYKIEFMILGGNVKVEKVECWNPIEEIE